MLRSSSDLVLGADRPGAMDLRASFASMAPEDRDVRTSAH